LFLYDTFGLNSYIEVFLDDDSFNGSINEIDGCDKTTLYKYLCSLY
jgi:hypothetical protein